MSDDKKPASTFLEFSPEPTTRTSRVEELLESTPVQNSSTVTLPPRSLNELRNLPVPANADLMQRLQSFLPAMEQSTQELQQRAHADPASLDIEHLDPSTQEYIEMNLGLGVYESRANRQSSPYSSDSSDTDSDSTTSSSSSSSGSDSDSEDSDASDRPDVLSVLMSAVPPVPRMPNPPVRPNIIMLHSDKRTSPESP